MRLGYTDLDILGAGSLQALVRAGMAVPVHPATDSGWKRYVQGRQFLPAATNLCKNPKPVHSAASLPGQWMASDNANSAYTYSDGGAYNGRTSKHINIVGGAGCSNKAGVVPKRVGTSGEIAAGEKIAFSFMMGEATFTGCTPRGLIAWYDNSGYIDAIGATITPTAGFTRFSMTGTAPSGTTRFVCYIRPYNDFSAGDIQDYSVCEVQVEKAAAATEYTDGDQADCEWSGTADASASSRPVSSLVYTDVATIGPDGVAAAGALTAYSQNAETGYYGPVVVANAAYGATQQAYLDANWSDIAALWRGVSVGDWLFPLGGDSVGFRKLGGDTVPFDDGLLAFDGNSLTGGAGVDPGEDYPSVVVAAVRNPSMGSWVKVNKAVGGQAINEMAADAEMEIDPLYSAAYHHNILCVWEGCNYIDDGHTGEELEAALADYCADRQAAGFRVVIMTVLPFGGEVARVGYEPQRQAANTLIRANWSSYADALADVAADSRIGDDGDQDDTDYYNVDMWHMTAAGYAIVAGIVQTAVEGLL